MRQLVSYTAALTMILGLGTAANAGPIVIDNFKGITTPLDSNANAFVSPPVNAIFTNLALNNPASLSPLRGFASSGAVSFVSPYPTLTVNETGVSGVLGGNRSTSLIFKSSSLSGANTFTINTTAGVLSYNADNGILGGLSLLYTFSTPQDFSGTNGFELAFANNNVGGPGQTLSVVTTIQDTGTSASLSPTIPQSGSPQFLFIPFSTMFPAPNSPGGANLSALTSIRFDFNISGNGGQSFGIAGITATAVPEPATLAIAGIFGIAGLVTARRKLKKNVEITTAA